MGAIHLSCARLGWAGSADVAARCGRIWARVFLWNLAICVAIWARHGGIRLPTSKVAIIVTRHTPGWRQGAVYWAARRGASLGHIGRPLREWRSLHARPEAGLTFVCVFELLLL